MSFWAILVSAIFFWNGCAWADLVEFANGQTLEGIVTEESEKNVTVEVEGSSVTFARADINAVTRKEYKAPPKKKIVAAPAEVKAPAASAAQPIGQTASATPSIQLDKLERPLLIFDERNWKLDFQNAGNNQVIAEFVPEGQSVKKWTEMVTAQLFIGLRSEPKHYVEYVKRTTKERCPSTEWNVIGESATDVMYEWSISGCQGLEDQSEIARVVLSYDGLHVLHYANKTKTMTEADRQAWAERLAAATIVKP